MVDGPIGFFRATSSVPINRRKSLVFLVVVTLSVLLFEVHQMYGLVFLFALANKNCFEKYNS